MTKIRLNLEVSRNLFEWWETASEEAGISRGALFAQGVALLVVCREAIKQGDHVGIVADRSKLDREITGSSLAPNTIYVQQMML